MINSFLKLYRYSKIYGFIRSFVKASGRLRLSLPLWILFSIKPSFAQKKTKDEEMIELKV